MSAVTSALMLLSMLEAKVLKYYSTSRVVKSDIEDSGIFHLLERFELSLVLSTGLDYRQDLAQGV